LTQHLAGREDVLSKYRVDKNSPIPLYYQLSQLIRQSIESGELKPGEQIPTEFELERELGISRATVRRAISDLVYEGLVVRQRAKGTIVAKKRLKKVLERLGSFTNEIMKQNLYIYSRQLEFRVIGAPPQMAELLELPSGEQVYYLRRLRIIDKDPVCVEDWYASCRRFPNLDRSYFKESGLEQSTYYVIQKHYGVELERAEDTIDAVALNFKEARLLNMQEGMPALLRTRVTYTKEDTPVMYSSGKYIIQLAMNRRA
jgi:GntR family transcriptional regulator